MDGPALLLPRVLSELDGERELTTGLLSKDADFRLIVSDRWGLKRSSG